MRHAPIDPELFVSHRARLRALLPRQCVAVVHAADILPTCEDGSLRIHPASDLFWLSGIEQEESVLVLAPDAIDPACREMLFIKQPSDHSAQWDGDKLTQERAREISGIATVRWLADLPKALHALACESDVVLLNSNEHERATTEVEPRDLRLARRLLDRYPLHRHDRLAPLMRRLRAVKDPAEEPACRRYFMHGLGHSLGLGVHDIAPIDGPFEPGWVITVEPGIYIPEEGIGVRLENDVLVTESGPVDLCSHVPILPDEIEVLMAERSVAAGCLT